MTRAHCSKTLRASTAQQVDEHSLCLIIFGMASHDFGWKH
jgi:hypothetical protein